jgi:hypothetical protein
MWLYIVATSFARKSKHQKASLMMNSYWTIFTDFQTISCGLRWNSGAKDAPNLVKDVSEPNTPENIIESPDLMF